MIYVHIHSSRGLVFQPKPTFTVLLIGMLVRLNLARDMLRRANTCIDRLENPEAASSASADQSTERPSPAAVSGDTNRPQSTSSGEVTTTDSTQETMSTNSATATRGSPTNRSTRYMKHLALSIRSLSNRYFC